MRLPSRNHGKRAAVALVAIIAACGPLAWLLSSPTAGGAVGITAGLPVPADEAEAALAAAPAQLLRSDAEQLEGYYTAPVGTVFTYAVHGACDYAVVHPEGGRQATGFRLRGSLGVVVADRRDGEIIAEVDLGAVELLPVAGGAASGQAAAEAGMRRPFHVRLDSDGAVRGYRFAAGLDGEQRNFMRGLFSAYAHRLPADAHGTWQSRDADAAGELVARFTLHESRAADADAVTVERKKLRYEAMAGADLHPHILAGQSRATFSRGLGWIHTVDVDDRMTLQLAELGVSVDIHAVFGFALQASGSRTSAPPAALWDEPWLAPAGHCEDVSGGGAEYECDQWRERLAGADLGSLTRALAALLAAEPQDAAAIDAAWQSIIWLVRLRPEAAAEIRQVVAAGTEARLGDMLVSALGAAGGDPAQAVLAAMRRDPTLSEALRRSATLAMFQLATPNERLLMELTTDIADAGELTGGSAMAMLLLGALAPRAGDARIGARTAFEALLAFEPRAAQEDRLDLWLDALGNVGTEAVVSQVQRFTHHELDSVRGAAFHALRRVETPAAAALLTEGLSDPSPSVRIDAVTALGEHGSPAAGEALIRAARDDADPAVRRAGQRALVRFARKDGPARRALAALAETDPDPQTRAAARDLIRALQVAG